MSDFRVPAGDPDGLRSVVTRLSRLSETVGETRSSRLRSAGQDAAAGLPAARVAAFAGARSDASKATGAIGLSLVAVGGALVDYADALQTAQQAVRDAAARYDDAQELWRQARRMGEPELTERYRQDMDRQARRAGTAQADLATARQRTAAALNDETEVWAPGAGSLAPVEAWQRATAAMLPPTASIDPQKLKELFSNPDVTLARETATNAVKGAAKSYALYGIVNYARSPALSARAEAKLLKARDLYQSLKGGAPDLDDPATYRKYIKAERAMLKAYMSDNPADVMRAQRHFRMLRGMQGEARALANVARAHPALTPAQIRGTAGRFDKLMRPVRAAGPVVARVMGPVSVAVGGYDIYTAATDSGMATDDRWARGVGGAASVAGGVATTLVAVGLVSNPVGLAVVAVAGVVAVGAWAYENREAIAAGAGKIAAGAKKVWKGLFG
ncbi:hypothetical protein [Cellulomonas sp. KH9]|uniref:hypothetical protein n=1 Tax=Cellulomonas sp. KH9 TaxID=1855324 RepID=UPI0008F3BAA3|nr:hypothetical protein [Cellulomonas sp. KH9]SFJ62633.1 hypothetical protein SAMN05216467_0234 [Cellulomonas sp. KH9]